MAWVMLLILIGGALAFYFLVLKKKGTEEGITSYDKSEIVQPKIFPIFSGESAAIMQYDPRLITQTELKKPIRDRIPIRL